MSYEGSDSYSQGKNHSHFLRASNAEQTGVTLTVAYVTSIF
jgi:hypothetical protein